MNFTREPIIETVITPKDGYKLSIRNSKGGSQEEYFVDVIEVVSFGQSMFFRSQERPKSFLLPVTDYEVVEAKETRVVLKNAPLEGSIKIGGGKVHKAPREAVEEKPHAAAVKPPSQEEGSGDRPRRRKSSSRRRRLDGEGQEGHRPQGMIRPPMAPHGQDAAVVAGDKTVTGDGEPPVSSSMFRNLFPPPSGLISEKFQHEKNLQAAKDAAAAELAKETSQEQQEEEPVVESAQENSSLPDFVEEDKEESLDNDKDTPRYHSAPREDNEGPFFRAETNFVY